MMEPQDTSVERDESDMASGAKCRMSDRVSATIQTTAGKVGDQMQNAAAAIRGAEPRLWSALHKGVESVAQELERGAGYFNDRRYEETVRKTTQYIRRHPAIAAAIAAIAGVLFAAKRRR
jgi:ElaB/YqjD/DUF883 family membrane-anchored ribosome-binding protein